MSREYGCRISGYAPKLVGVGAGYKALPAPAATADLRQWCTGTQDQIGSQCVGEAFANAHWIAVRNQGQRASHRGIYVDARVRERLRQQDAIPDAGSDPGDAADALVSVGVYPLDARDSDPAAINAMADWSETSARKLVDITDLLPIAKGDTTTIDQVLTLGFPVVDWMQIDNSFEKLSGKTVWQGMVGPSIGGHATVIVGKLQSGDYILWNSWGTNWGDNGFFYVARSVMAANAGLCGVLGGPVL